MKQDKMVDYQKNRKMVLETETLAIIKKMVAKGKTINFSTVSKATKRTVKYLYDHPRIRAEIEAHRKPVTSKTEEAAQTEVTIVKMEYKRLKKEYEKLIKENGESWKQKYDAEHQKRLELFHENQELKRQIKSLYSSEQVVQATQ